MNNDVVRPQAPELGERPGDQQADPAQAAPATPPTSKPSTPQHPDYLDAIVDPVNDAAKILGDQFQIDVRLRMPFMYGFQLTRMAQPSKEDVFKFVPHNRVMPLSDAIEITKRIAGTFDQDIYDILTTPASDPRFVNVDITRLAEGPFLKDRFENHVHQNLMMSPYLCLMRLPARSRSFYTGIIAEKWQSNPTGVWCHMDKKLITPREFKPYFTFTTSDILAYGRSLNATDVRDHLKAHNEVFR